MSNSRTAISEAQVLSLLAQPPKAVVEPSTADPQVSPQSLAEQVSVPETPEAIAPTPVEPIKAESEPFGNSTALLLSTLLNPEALQVLKAKTQFAEADLLNLPLKQVLAELTPQDIMGPWVSSSIDGVETLSAKFLFGGFNIASSFLYRMMGEFRCSGHRPKSIALLPDNEPEETNVDSDNDDDWLVEIQLATMDTGKLSPDDIKLAQFANYSYSDLTTKSKSTPYYDDYYYAEPLTKQSLADSAVPNSAFLTSHQPLPLVVLGDKGQKLLQIPVARIGEWKHPLYGDIEFSQEDFDEIVANFGENILGYEPPLFLGHRLTLDTVEGDPAEGFLNELFQDGEVLYGKFEVVNEPTYDAVAKGQFRYSSGEFVRQYSSKETGDVMGTTLVGMALTNRPFLTGLPKVSTLSDTPTLTTVIPLADTVQQAQQSVRAPTKTARTAIKLTTPPQPSNQSPMNAPNDNLSTTPVAEPTVAVTAPETQNFAEAQNFADFKAMMLSEFNQLKEAYSAEVAGLKQTYEAKLQSTQAEVDTLKQKAEFAETQLRQTEIATKLKELNGLTLPIDVKQKYSEMIQQGTLGANEAEVFATLRQISQNMSATMKTQYGTSTTTQSFNDELLDDPYKTVTERNRSVVKAREERLAGMLQ